MSYIVINDTYGTAMRLQKSDTAEFPRVPKLGVLVWDDRTATEFGTRERAQRAISRTDAYHAPRGTPNRLRMVHRIIRLVPEDLAK